MEPKTRRGTLGYMFWPVTAAGRAAKACLNLDAIRAGRRDISTLWALARQKRPDEPPVLFDLDEGLRRSLWNTAYATRVYLGAAAGTLILWVWMARDATPGLAMTVSALGALLIVGMFGLMAFLQAYRHWKARRGGVGGLGDFLRTSDPWWPRMPRR